MDTFEMEYQSVDDIDEIKNRNDKSKLSMKKYRTRTQDF
jgi:hypothetical protein